MNAPKRIQIIKVTEQYHLKQMKKVHRTIILRTERDPTSVVGTPLFIRRLNRHELRQLKKSGLPNASRSDNFLFLLRSPSVSKRTPHFHKDRLLKAGLLFPAITRDLL